MQRRRGLLPSPRTCDFTSIGVAALGDLMVWITNVTALLMLDDVSSFLSDCDGGY